MRNENKIRLLSSDYKEAKQVTTGKAAHIYKKERRRKIRRFEKETTKNEVKTMSKFTD